jgi:hypothetical protein
VAVASEAQPATCGDQGSSGDVTGTFDPARLAHLRHASCRFAQATSTVPGNDHGVCAMTMIAGSDSKPFSPKNNARADFLLEGGRERGGLSAGIANEKATAQ